MCHTFNFQLLFFVVVCLSFSTTIQITEINNQRRRNILNVVVYFGLCCCVGRDDTYVGKFEIGKSHIKKKNQENPVKMR